MMRSIVLHLLEQYIKFSVTLYILFLVRPMASLAFYDHFLQVSEHFLERSLMLAERY